MVPSQVLCPRCRTLQKWVYFTLPGPSHFYRVLDLDQKLANTALRDPTRAFQSNTSSHVRFHRSPRVIGIHTTLFTTTLPLNPPPTVLLSGG